MLTDNQTVSYRSAPSVSAVRVVAAPSDDKGMRALSLVRYVAVGACNTIFGYGCFAMFTLLLTPLLSYGYVLASLLANLFSLTFTFLGYNRFVFKMRGNYLKEWIRCVGVYASSMVLAVAALPWVVGVIRRQPGHERSAPYIAGAIVLVFSIVFSSLAIAIFPSRTEIRPRKTDLD
jgi:putative flippase GtrA